MSQVSQDNEPIWSQLWDNPSTRYLLLAPSVLSALAGLSDIGKLAAELTRLWRPFLQSVFAFVQDVLYLPPYISAELIVISVFFLPFTVSGVVGYYRGRSIVEVNLAIAGCIAYQILWFMIDESSIPKGIADVLTLEGASIMAWNVLPLLVALIAFLVSWRRNSSTISVVFVPSVAALLSVLLAIVDLYSFRDADTASIIFSVLITALPLFNPRRLVDAAALACGVVAISAGWELGQKLIG